MKKMKQILSMLLAALLVCALFMGCDGDTGEINYEDDPAKQVTLTIALPNAMQKDTAKVQDEINKQLETLLPNTKVELMMDANMADKWALWMSITKEIDIAHSGFATNIEDEVRKESYLELDELVEQYAPNIQKLQEEYWYSYDMSSVNGTLYAIPNIQYLTKEATSFKIWTEAAAYVDLQALVDEAWSSDKTTKKFYEILTAGLEAAEKAGVDCSGCVSLTMYKIAQRGYNILGGEDSCFCYDNSDSGTILNFYETQEFKDFCEVMKLWASKGWVSKDILTGQWTDKLYVSTTYRYKMDPVTGIQTPIVDAENPTHTIMVIDKDENTTLTTDIGQNRTYYSIPYTSKNPGRAMRFLDLINSDAGAPIINLLAYGIEGTHYEVTDKENGNIKAFEYEAQGSNNVSYGVPCWMATNMMQGMYNVAPYTHEFKDYGKDYYLNRMNNYKKHALYGFSFDLEPINSEISKILKNNGEYAESIYCGIVADTDTLIKELNDKNKAAGYDKVLKELQDQANAFLNAK